MKEMLRILSIDSADLLNTLRHALLQRVRCHLSTANTREIFEIPVRERPDIAIFDQTTSPHELRASCEYIRRSWPAARILVVCPNIEYLDDPLYDEWLSPDPSQQALFGAIEQLAAIGRHSEREAPSQTGARRLPVTRST